MAPISKNHVWTDVKAALAARSTTDLVALLRDLYQVSPENRRFLHGRLLGPEVEIEKYRTLIADAVYPDPLSQARIRISEAQRLIRHYYKATGDLPGVVDLMFTFVEAGTEQAADLGYGDEDYFASLERTFRTAIDTLNTLDPAIRTQADSRVQKIVRRADSIGWGYCDSVREIAASLGAPKPRRTQANRRRSTPARRSVTGLG